VKKSQGSYLPVFINSPDNEGDNDQQGKRGGSFHVQQDIADDIGHACHEEAHSHMRCEVYHLGMIGKRVR
jgi:hypothetical protein